MVPTCTILNASLRRRLNYCSAERKFRLSRPLFDRQFAKPALGELLVPILAFKLPFETAERSIPLRYASGKPRQQLPKGPRGVPTSSLLQLNSLK